MKRLAPTAVEWKLLLGGAMSRAHLALPLLVASVACESTTPLTTAIDAGSPDASADGALADRAADQAPPDLVLPDHAPADLAPDREGDVAPAPDTQLPEPAPRSFIVHATLEPTGANPIVGVPPPPPPATDTFTIHVTDTGTLVASRDAAVATAKLALQANGWKTAEMFSLSLPTSPSCSQGIVSMTYAEIAAVNENGQLRGTLKGYGHFQSGDVLTPVPFAGTFVATADREPPRFRLEKTSPHPADVLRVLVSEALPAGTQAKLVGPDGTTVALSPGGQSGQPAALFYTARALGQRAGYRLVVTPAVDLGGNPTPPEALPTVDTTSIPLVPEDGFEGTTKPWLLGDAAVVGADRLPPIAGQRSLMLPGGYTNASARASMRLRVSGGKRFVRATVRGLIGPAGSGPNVPLNMVALAPDGTSAPGKMDPLALPITEVGPSQSLGSPQPLEFALPAGAKDEVLIDFHWPLYCGLVAPSLGLLVDDLRVE